MMLMFADGKLVIGLTKGNIDRLVALEPATVRGPRPIHVQDIMVIYGDTKLHIMQQLEASGVEFAKAMKDSIAEDPS